MPDDSSAVARSAVTNGRFLAGVDGRSTWARRARDLLMQLVEDRGGDDYASEAEKLILRRAAVLAVECERLESRFAVAEQSGETPTDPQLDLYARLSNSLRRHLEATGLQRRARDVTPSLRDVLAQHREQSGGTS